MRPSETAIKHSRERMQYRRHLKLNWSEKLWASQNILASLNYLRTGCQTANRNPTPYLVHIISRAVEWDARKSTTANVCQLVPCSYTKNCFSTGHGLYYKVCLLLAYKCLQTGKHDQYFGGLYCLHLHGTQVTVFELPFRWRQRALSKLSYSRVSFFISLAVRNTHTF
jgi:hypothetical protein